MLSPKGFAKKLHPSIHFENDTNKGDADAENKFQEVEPAYEVSFGLQNA
jgi:DnaJ-class molecular chaperone